LQKIQRPDEGAKPETVRTPSLISARDPPNQPLDIGNYLSLAKLILSSAKIKRCAVGRSAAVERLPALDTGQILRLPTRPPWQSVLNAASAARARPPAVAEAIGDHSKLPKGVVRQPGIKIMFLLVKPDGMSAKESH
jgi:hypothetical protein